MPDFNDKESVKMNSIINLEVGKEIVEECSFGQNLNSRNSSMTYVP